MKESIAFAIDSIVVRNFIPTATKRSTSSRGSINNIYRLRTVFAFVLMRLL